ncbi:MAG TPA: HAMP domain-containing sensor histidine kinase [Longimicrobiales bacterium]|nr:HAMP domain-containing sensor histidine kinase [Longimicrobiales bacterium]
MKRLTLIVGLVVGWWAGRCFAPRGARPGEALPGPAPSQFDFLSLMSHELNTPLNIITGYLELLESGVPEPLSGAAREQVHHARLAAVRMSQLVNDLLTWTRLESGRRQVHPEWVAAVDIVQEVCGPLVEQAEEQGIRLDLDVPRDIHLWTDPSHVCQALRALVSNGLKFTESGSVRVSVTREDGRVRFHVRDSGIGIRPEHLDDIFKPYWQLEATVRRTRGGVGIGLTVARQLAELLGGVITVRSTPGNGSEFVLDLPGE